VRGRSKNALSQPLSESKSPAAAGPHQDRALAAPSLKPKDSPQRMKRVQALITTVFAVT
jgi:hypothetical protein